MEALVGPSSYRHPEGVFYRMDLENTPLLYMVNSVFTAPLSAWMSSPRPSVPAEQSPAHAHQKEQKPH